MAGEENPFDTQRPLYFGIAYRILGSVTDAEDVVQDAYLRWSAVDHASIVEPRRYISRIVTRLAIDRLRHRANHETYIGQWLPEPLATDDMSDSFGDPALKAETRDSLSVATLHLMETLDPVERAVFVLRHAFELPYKEIAEATERTADHCRQIFRRASRRMADGDKRFSPNSAQHGALLGRFLSAANQGNLDQLLDLLHSEAVLWSDGGGKVKASLNPIYGSDRISRFAVGIYAAFEPDITMRELNGAPAAIIQSATGTYIMSLALQGNQIAAIYIMGNPEKIQHVRGDGGTHMTL